MIEVFKTNVQSASCAEKVLYHIRQLNLRYDVNFDLEDKDRILRIEHKAGEIDSQKVVILLEQLGFCAEVLMD